MGKHKGKTKIKLKNKAENLEYFCPSDAEDMQVYAHNILYNYERKRADSLSIIQEYKDRYCLSDDEIDSMDKETYFFHKVRNEEEAIIRAFLGIQLFSEHDIDDFLLKWRDILGLSYDGNSLVGKDKGKYKSKGKRLDKKDSSKED